MNIVGKGLSKHQKKCYLIPTLPTLIFRPRPFCKFVKIPNSLLKLVEPFPAHQNVRNGHIYISVMKQHRVKNAYFSRKSQKTIFSLSLVLKSAKIITWLLKVVETFLIHQNVRNGHIYIGVMNQHIC